MTPRAYTLVLLMATVRLCTPQSVTFNLAKFKVDADTNNDGNVTRAELNDLFVVHIGRNTSGRCPFTAWLIENFEASPPRVSALYDLMQSSVGVVSSEDFTGALLGGPNVTVVTPSDLTTVVNALDARIDKVTSNPSTYTSGPTFWQYNLFEADRWADNCDMDNNSYISRQEVSIAMRSLDQNGDGNIYRCEFVNSMTRYKQHTETSSKVYDAIFSLRDLTWSDADSDFLLGAIEDKDGAVTKAHFAEYFKRENQIAAGATVVDADPLGGDDSAPHSTVSILLCLTSSFIVFMSKFIIE